MSIDSVPIIKIYSQCLRHKSPELHEMNLATAISLYPPPEILGFPEPFREVTLTTGGGEISGYPRGIIGLLIVYT